MTCVECLLEPELINESWVLGCVVSNQRPPNDVLTIHILTGLWHFYGDTRWEPTPHTMMQNPMPHNMLPLTRTHQPPSIRFRPHPQNCNQTPFRGAPGSILKILCILKLPNKKEKFVFIIQNSFQLSRRDCEVFNKQNSAAALGRGRNTTTLLHSSNKRTKVETENCSRGRAAQVYTGQIGGQI